MAHHYHGRADAVSHQEWEAQLSGIIERTNANLSALSTRYNSPGRPAPTRNRGGGGGGGGGEGAGERGSQARRGAQAPAPPPPPPPPLSGRVSADTIDDALLDRICERVASRLEKTRGGSSSSRDETRGGDAEAVARLEDEVQRLRAQTTSAVATARAHESSVESLSRESQARKSTASRMMAWQADAEAWRARVDARLEASIHKTAALEAARRSAAPSSSSSKGGGGGGGGGGPVATRAELEAVAENAQRCAAAASSTAMAAVQERLERDIEEVRQHVAHLRLARGDERLSREDAERAAAATGAFDFAVSSAVASAASDVERRLETRIGDAVGAQLRAEAAANEARFRDDMARRQGPLRGATEEDDDDGAVHSAVDVAVAALVKRVDEARDEARALRDIVEAAEKERRRDVRRLDEAVEHLGEALESRVVGAVSATHALRSAISDEAAASRQRLDAAKAEVYGSLHAQVGEWAEDRAKASRQAGRHDKSIQLLEEKYAAIKVAARAYAEDAPAVKRAAALASKIDGLDARLRHVDDFRVKLSDFDHRASRERGRLDRLEQWREGEAAEQLAQLAALRDVDKAAATKIAKLEVEHHAVREALAEVKPSRLTKLEAKVGEVAKFVDDREAKLREKQRDGDYAITDIRDKVDVQIGQLKRQVDDQAETLRRATDDAARAVVAAQTRDLPTKVDGALARLDGLEDYLKLAPENRNNNEKNNNTPAQSSQKRDVDDYGRRREDLSFDGKGGADDARMALLEDRVADCERSLRSEARGASASHVATLKTDLTALERRVDDVAARGLAQQPAAATQPKSSSPSRDRSMLRQAADQAAERLGYPLVQPMPQHRATPDASFSPRLGTPTKKKTTTTTTVPPAVAAASPPHSPKKQQSPARSPDSDRRNSPIAAAAAVPSGSSPAKKESASPLVEEFPVKPQWLDEPDDDEFDDPDTDEAQSKQVSAAQQLKPVVEEDDEEESLDDDDDDDDSRIVEKPPPVSIPPPQEKRTTPAPAKEATPPPATESDEEGSEEEEEEEDDDDDEEESESDAETSGDSSPEKGSLISRFRKRISETPRTAKKASPLEEDSDEDDSAFDDDEDD